MSFEIPKNALEEAIRRANDDPRIRVSYISGQDGLSIFSGIRGYTKFIVELGEVLEEIGMTGSDYMWQLADAVDDVIADGSICRFTGIKITE